MFVFLGIVIALLAGLIIFVATRAAESHIERSAEINAPPETVFSIINDLHQWETWSPYDKRDPNMQKSYDGPPEGSGAVYVWNGNKDVGEGRLTIVNSKPGELVTMKLEFTRPFKCTNDVNFKLVPSGAGTRVSWIMDGKNNFVSKAMCLVMDMDKMVGKDFEQGLANLNTVAQAKASSVH
jgi:carbon monoxide dehydrogenase subunit G